jgi:hypothetical protein
MPITPSHHASALQHTTARIYVVYVLVYIIPLVLEPYPQTFQRQFGCNTAAWSNCITRKQLTLNLSRSYEEICQLEQTWLYISSLFASCCVSWLVVFGLQHSDTNKPTELLKLVLFDGFYMFRSTFGTIFRHSYQILSFYGSTALCWTLAAFSVSWYFTRSVGLLARGISPFERPLPAHRTTQTRNKRTQTSMPRVGFESSDRGFESHSRHALLCSVRTWVTLHQPCLYIHVSIAEANSSEM